MPRPVTQSQLFYLGMIFQMLFKEAPSITLDPMQTIISRVSPFDLGALLQVFSLIKNWLIWFFFAALYKWH